MVGFGDLGEAVLEVGERDGEAGLALENDYVFAAEGAAPGGGCGGGGEAAGEEVGGGGADFRHVVDDGVFREGRFEGLEGGDGGGGGLGGEVVAGVVLVGAESGGVGLRYRKGGGGFWGSGFVGALGLNRLRALFGPAHQDEGVEGGGGGGGGNGVIS